MSFKFEDSTSVDSSAVIGSGSRIWQNTQIRDEVVIGTDCVIGRNVYIGSGVTLGNRCKIQNNALIYEPAKIADGVFIGPGVIFTNDQYPRAINPDSTLKSNTDWIPVGVVVQEGASIGAGAVCVAPVQIGKWSLVAAGSVVTRNVPNFALIAGVPGRQIGWVGKSGFKLIEKNGMYICPETYTQYKLSGEVLEEMVQP